MLQNAPCNFIRVSLAKTCPAISLFCAITVYLFKIVRAKPYQNTLQIASDDNILLESCPPNHIARTWLQFIILVKKSY